ncbi:MAG: LytTR family DNA-binding domain-containing protein [Eubacteriales bacterium]
MLKIAICDDEEVFVNDIERKIVVFFAFRNIDIKVSVFTEATKFMNSKISEYDIIFLDVEMGEYNGIKLASKVRAQNPEAILVYISSFIQYAVDSYTVRAFYYLLKDNLEETLTMCLLEIIKMIPAYSKKFTIPVSNERIAIKDIIYLESKDHFIFVHKLDGNFVSYYGKLSQVEDFFIENDFLRVQQSFIVNMQYILRFQNRTVELSNGENLNCSKKTYKAMTQAYILWKGRS